MAELLVSIFLLCYYITFAFISESSFSVNNDASRVFWIRIAKLFDSFLIKCQNQSTFFLSVITLLSVIDVLTDQWLIVFELCKQN